MPADCRQDALSGPTANERSNGEDNDQSGCLTEILALQAEKVKQPKLYRATRHPAPSSFAHACVLR